MPTSQQKSTTKVDKNHTPYNQGDPQWSCSGYFLQCTISLQHINIFYIIVNAYCSFLIVDMRSDDMKIILTASLIK